MVLYKLLSAALFFISHIQPTIQEELGSLTSFNHHHITMNLFNLKSCSTDLFGCLVLLLLSITWADPIRPLNSTETSAIGERMDLPDPSRTVAQESETVEDSFYNFLKINPSQPPHSPPVVQSLPADAPPSYPTEHVPTTQSETVADVDDPLYNFLKNILPQVPTQEKESESPSVPALDPVNPSYAAEHVQTTPQKFADKNFFLRIDAPPKPRALGFPQITNTRENVVQQNNWVIL